MRYNGWQVKKVAKLATGRLWLRGLGQPAEASHSGPDLVGSGHEVLVRPPDHRLRVGSPLAARRPGRKTAVHVDPYDRSCRQVQHVVPDKSDSFVGSLTR